MKDYLQIHPEGIMLQIIEVQPHLVGIDDFVVVALRVIDLGKDFHFIAVFQRDKLSRKAAKTRIKCQSDYLLLIPNLFFCLVVRVSVVSSMSQMFLRSSSFRVP